MADEEAPRGNAIGSSRTRAIPTISYQVEMKAPLAAILNDLSQRLEVPVGKVFAQAVLLLKLALDAESQGKQLVLLNPDGSIDAESVHTPLESAEA